jgi:PAS domain S-box-containing protein
MVELTKSSAKDFRKKKLKDSQSVNIRRKYKSFSKTSSAILSRERLQAILENIPSAVIVVEKPRGKIIYANNRSIELHGVNPCGLEISNHASKLRIFKLNGQLFPSKELYTYRALFHGETLRDKPVIIERLTDKQRFIINVSAQPLYENGQINAAIVIFDDVTERVKTEIALKESENRLNMAQQIAHLGNWEYYVKEDKAIWSEELFRIFGLEPKPFGPSVNEYVMKILPEDREAINEKMENIMFQDPSYSKISFDYRIVRQDGTLRTIHSERMIGEVDANNKPIRIIGVEQDITERKLIEQQLEVYAKNLESLVDERTKQLKDAERLAAIGQTAGMIGHDIRNPLQAIAGELFLMKGEIDSAAEGQCKEELKESLYSIQEQVDYINKIISDLQDYSRPLKPDMVDVDLCETIPKLLITVPLPNNIEAFAVCNKHLPTLKLDLTFLKRILVNLATNAIQAMPNGGTLTIKTYKKKDKVVISVEDTGVGIPEDIKPKLFQPLMTTKSKGQGFGLAVVKRLVETQGGSIRFESESGKGTKFIIEFPVG